MCTGVSIIMSNNEYTGIYQELWIRSEILVGDCGLQATAVEVKMNPYPGSSCGNQSMVKGKPWNIFTYVDLLKQDTGLEEPDITTAMLDMSVWSANTVRDVSTYFNLIF